MLERYSAEDFIAEDEAVVTTCKRPACMTAGHYSEVLCENALRCSMVYNYPRLKEIFIEAYVLPFVVQCLIANTTQRRYITKLDVSYDKPGKYTRRLS